MNTDIVARNVKEFRAATEADPDICRLNTKSIRAFYDASWPEFVAECREAGVDPDETLDAIVDALLARP